MIKLVHASVPGRIRLEIPGLYRSPHLRQRMERQLEEIDAVYSVKANTRTGRLLLIHAKNASIEGILQQIEALLESRPHHSSISDNDPARSEPRFSRMLDGMAALIKGFSSSYTTLPQFAAISGAAPANEPEGPQTQQIQPWHQLELAQILDSLDADDGQGLTGEEAIERLHRYGQNSLVAAQRRSDLLIFLEQFMNAPVGMLGASAVISILTGGAMDAAVILGVVLINAVIGFVTERQAELTISSLAKSGVREVMALRDGTESLIPVEQIVPGDVLVLVPGSYIAADIRLMKSHRLSVDESALTGESLPVTKDHNFIGTEETALGDRSNMAFMGTHVTGGNGRGVVIATAKATELGQIQTMVGEAEAPETPMQRQLDQMGTKLALLSGVVCAGVFVVGVLRGYGMLEMLKSSVSLAVAAVPEGLPAVATTTLAMGIAEMRKRNVSIRHLDAVESLGSVQVFCMDKTGTLTMNRMAVVAVYSGELAYGVTEGVFRRDDKAVDPVGREELVRLMQIVSLCSESEIVGNHEHYELEGSPTENALVDLALNAGIDVQQLRADHPTRRTRYRAEGRPFMSTLHPYKNGKYLLAVKGSPEELLSLCDFQVMGGKRVRLNAAAKAQIIAQNEVMAGNALRVLGAAYRELDKEAMPTKTAGLTWLGLAGMADPMRTGMDQLIAQYHEAGIATIMITGDQSATAQAIGEQLGLSGGKPLKVLESKELENMDPELLAGLAKNVHVFARVSPAHKLKIVRALQESGYVVAMTGDGINDGPALKAADVGVAMGGGGTNVARDVSDVVLEDDNLHTMAVAVEQGRSIYSNIRKMIHFMVSTNLTEIEVMLAGIAMGWGEPLNPMQLLWINLVTDIFPGLALSLEPAEPGIMQRDPRDPDEAIIEGKDLKHMSIESGIIGLGTLGAFLYGMKRYGLGAEASTLAFNTLVFNELAHSLSSRSRYRNVFGGQELPPNPHLTKAILGMGGLQAIVSLLPGARRLLGTTPLNPLDILVIAAGVLLPLIVNEMNKPALPQVGNDRVLEGELQAEATAEERV
ncbi:MAG: HAD-IC family P-type ATPase [Gammaproteobacteria bacterium]|nr:HAD-IC family P-type ATPase [Gammaproteobacteria bacterium]